MSVTLFRPGRIRKTATVSRQSLVCLAHFRKDIGSMTGHEDSQQDLHNLKQLFTQRVLHQSQLMQELWDALCDAGEWSTHDLQDLVIATQKLQNYAERFEQPAHAQLAVAIGQCLQALVANQGTSHSPLAVELNTLMHRLAHTGLRHGDEPEGTQLPPLRKPIYLALLDAERSTRLARQLEFFGFTALVLPTEHDFRVAMATRRPAAVIMETDFAGPGVGLALAASLQQAGSERIPVLFFSEEEADTRIRLAAVRAGGMDFFCGSLDASALLERLEDLTNTTPQDPYKVLVIDDSRAQAMFTERVLKSAGIITRTLTDPIQAMAELNDFQPDLIVLDMYMPECNGTELARVIRHNERYVSVPIIYLSGEEDLNKQLDAMSEGGDDFLNKPVQPHHLIATVNNRAARARNLKARMVRDSLTGLYNHTHILQLLEDSCLRARREQKPMCFAMLDIDHFKQVNDSFGHPMGDRVIRSLALLLKQRLRKGDYIGRYGGEEFAVVLPATDALNAARVLDMIRERFSELHYPAQPHDLTCTFSAGVAQLHGDLDVKQLASLADEALYQAKRAGRNRVEIYRPDDLRPQG